MLQPHQKGACMLGFGEKKKEWSLSELNAVFNKHDAAMRQMMTYSPDVQGVMLDIDPKTNEPFGRVVLSKTGATKPADIPASFGGFTFKAEYNR